MSYSSTNIHELNEEEYNRIFNTKCIKTGNKCFIISAMHGNECSYIYHIFVDSYLRYCYNDSRYHIIKHDITNTYIFEYLKKINQYYNYIQESTMCKWFDLSNPIHKIDSSVIPRKENTLLKEKLKQIETDNFAKETSIIIHKKENKLLSEQIKKLEEENQMLLQSIETYKSVILLIHNKK